VTTPRKPVTPIRCPECGATWTGLGRAHCRGECHRSFSTASAFDAHRRDIGSKGTCVDPATLLDKAGEPRFRLEAGLWRYAGDNPRLVEDEDAA
jgi:hypothetical protein